MNMHNPDMLSAAGQAALEYAERGWHVFPAPPGTKQSYKKAADYDGRKWGGTTDHDEIRDDFLRWPKANVGIRTGPESGFFVIDLDVKSGADGVQWLREKIEEHGDWPDTIEALTPSGGWHVYFRYPDRFDPKTCEGLIAPGVDVRGHGGIVLGVPSVKPGAAQSYRWKNPPGLFDLAPAPEWLLELLPKRGESKAKGTGDGGFKFDTGHSSKDVEAYRQLFVAARTDGQKHGATRNLAASLAAHGVPIKVTTGLILAVTPDHGHDDNLLNNIRSAYEKFGSNSFRHTGLDLVRDSRNRPIWNAANAETLLLEHPDWQGVLAYNAFTRSRVLLRPIPGQPGGSFPRDLEDDDYTCAQIWFNRHGFPKATAAIVVSAVRNVCRSHTFDPLNDYLDGLRWDGARRIGGWLTRYCGADDNDYTREVGRRWLISAVARAYKPGCKADHMLVLEGAQGARKSSVLAALAGPEWFSDSLPPMNTKDASSYLRGKWIVEVAELEAMRREVDAIKAFISRQVEDYRPAYDREDVREPRRCVFAGTTNKDDWQRDETGGRRFWPVRVGEIDVAAVARDRDQIWAEAVAAFRAGERWWLEGVAECQAKAESAARQPDDPWLGDIANILRGRDEIAAKQVLALLGFEAKDMTPVASKRVGQALTRLGWQRDGMFTSGPFKALARYVPPAGRRS